MRKRERVTRASGLTFYEQSRVFLSYSSQVNHYTDASARCLAQYVKRIITTDRSLDSYM